MREYVVAAAERRGLAHQGDAVGNVVVRVPASLGREGAPAVVLQSHLDMVNEKNSDVPHDFTRDPILLREVGEYLYATGTTLGADNGIGGASMLALMEGTEGGDELAHGPWNFSSRSTRRPA
jgi:dipeptidase D